jgi:hypothetical protein
MAYKIWLGVNGQRELRHATYGNINRSRTAFGLLKAPELQRLSVTVKVLRVGVMIVGVISVGVLIVGVMTLSQYFKLQH